MNDATENCLSGIGESRKGKKTYQCRRIVVLALSAALSASQNCPGFE